MASFYEASTSGLNFDRFADELFGESTKLRMKQTYWTAKQLLREKLGKREDDHVMAADAELDMHLQRFQQVSESSRQLLDGLARMQRGFSELAKYEFDLAEMLSNCQDEKEHLQRVMQMTANSEALSASERQKMMRSSLVRFYHQLDEFYERAIIDCQQSVEAVERSRLEYRGSLLWMKDCSETLDPERKNSNNLEDFRTVQNVVKGNKKRLDQLKEDVVRKVELLLDARAKLFQECLDEYKSGLFKFFEATAAEYSACAEEMSGLESYEIDVLKILNDPIGMAMEKQREEKQKGKLNGRFRAERANIPQRRRFESENDESLIELEEVEVAEVCEPEMDRVRELLRFDDGPEERQLLFGEEEVDLMKPVSSGLNLLKHSNELDAFGLTVFEQTKQSKGPNKGFERKTDTEDLLAELNLELDIGREESESPLAILEDEPIEGGQGKGVETRPVEDVQMQGLNQTKGLTGGKSRDVEVPRLAPPSKQPASKIGKSIGEEVNKNAPIFTLDQPIGARDNHFLLEEVEEEELLRQQC